MATKNHISSSLTPLFCFLLAAVLSSVTSFPSGAPSYSCRNMIPGHSNGSQTSPPPYRVNVSSTVMGAGERATVSVASIGDFPFLGFICAASRLEDTSHVPVGMMSHSLGFQEKDLIKAVSCSKSDPDTAMTHTSRRGKVRVEFDWAPPADTVSGQGYKMRCSVVQSFYRCWTGIQVNIFIGQTATQFGNRNDATSSDNNNNNNALANSDSSQFQQPPTIAITNNDFSRTSSSSSLVNPNPNQLSDFPLPSPIQNQQDQTTLTRIPDPNSIAIIQTDTNTPEFLPPGGISLLSNIQNQFPSHSVPNRNTLSSSSTSFRNQQNDIFLPPITNEIPVQSQSLDLGLLLDLINMGVITLQDGVISFNSIQSPTFNLNTNTISHGERLTSANNLNSRTTFNENSPRSFSGPNSKGLFQSSRPRPFNPNFNRIRQPQILERL